MEMALIENVAREQLNPVDEARACATLVEDLGLTKEELGRRLGRSRAALSNLIRILDLPDEALELLEAGALTEGHGRAILIAKSADERRQLARDAASSRLVGARDREARQRRRLRPGRSCEPSRTPTWSKRSAAPRMRSRPRSAAASRSAPSARALRMKAEIRFDDLDELLAYAASDLTSVGRLSAARCRRSRPRAGCRPGRGSRTSGVRPRPLVVVLDLDAGAPTRRSRIDVVALRRGDEADVADARAAVLGDGRVVLGQELAVEEQEHAGAEPEDSAVPPARDLAAGRASRGRSASVSSRIRVIEREGGLEDSGQLVGLAHP